MRLAAYEDAIYHREGSEVFVHRAFPLFMAGLATEVDAVTLLGRVHPAPGRSHYALPSDVEFIPLPYYESLAHPVAVLRALVPTLRRFWRVLGEVDAIWVNGPQPVAVIVVALARLRGRPAILGVRQNTVEYARSRHPGRRLPLAALRSLEAVWRWLARRRSVVAVGPELAEHYSGARRLLEIGVSFVSAGDIAEPAIAEARDWEGELRVLSVGRLEDEKNPLLLADVLAGLAADGRAWRLVVCGEGPLGAALEERLRALGVADRADLVGYIPLDRGLFDLYRSSHLFLHVSWTEGLPQVLFEAFAARLPVVATDVGSVAAAADGAALLVPPGDAAAAAAAVRRVAAEPELRDAMVEAGVQRVRAHTREAELHRLARWIESVTAG